MPARSDQPYIWVGNNLRAGESDEASVILNQLVGIELGQPFRMHE
jgi:hypothetical protein